MGDRPTSVPTQEFCPTALSRMAEDAERYRDLVLFHPVSLDRRSHWSDSAIGVPGRISFAIAIDQSNAGWVLRCPSLPEVEVHGADRDEVFQVAQEVIASAIDRRVAAGTGVPMPELGEPRVDIGLATSLRLALHWALRTEGASLAEMARMLGWPVERAAALLSPGPTVPCDDLDEALAYLGLRLTIALEPL